MPSLVRWPAWRMAPSVPPLRPERKRVANTGRRGCVKTFVSPQLAARGVGRHVRKAEEGALVLDPSTRSDVSVPPRVALAQRVWLPSKPPSVCLGNQRNRSYVNRPEHSHQGVPSVVATPLRVFRQQGPTRTVKAICPWVPFRWNL